MRSTSEKLKDGLFDGYFLYSLMDLFFEEAIFVAVQQFKWS